MTLLKSFKRSSTMKYQVTIFWSFVLSEMWWIGMENRQTAYEKLIELAEKQGYVTFDNIPSLFKTLIGSATLLQLAESSFIAKLLLVMFLPMKMILMILHRVIMMQYILASSNWVLLLNPSYLMWEWWYLHKGGKSGNSNIKLLMAIHMHENEWLKCTCD